MNEDKLPITVRVRAVESKRQLVPPTALELSAALTFTHRLANLATQKLAEAANIERPAQATQFAEPSFVNVEVHAARTGSVILEGFIAIAAHPFAQGVAGGVLANVITPALASAAERLKRTFRRIPPANADRELIVEVDTQGLLVQIRIENSDNGRSRVSVTTQPTRLAIGRDEA